MGGKAEWKELRFEGSRTDGEVEGLEPSEARLDNAKQMLLVRLRSAL